jgi:molybdate transport system substrate-binding protein
MNINSTIAQELIECATDTAESSMNKRFLLLGFLTFAWTLCAAQLPPIKVLTTGAYKPMLVSMGPVFEAQTGRQLQVINDTAGALLKRIQAGEDFDAVVLTPTALQTLSSQEKILPTSITPLAKVAIGVAVKSGKPVPNMATVEDFQRALQLAPRIALINPISGGSSGIYLNGLFQRMGLSDMVQAKAVLVNGGLVAEKLITDEADLAIHQISEILPVQGVTLAGALPEAIQNYTHYAGAISSSSLHAGAVKTLLEVMASETARAQLLAKGMMTAP